MVDKTQQAPPPPTNDSSSVYARTMALFTEVRLLGMKELDPPGLAAFERFMESTIAEIQPCHFYREDGLMRLTTMIYSTPSLSSYLDILMFRFFALLGTEDEISRAVDVVNNALFYGLDWSFQHPPPKKVKDSVSLSIVPAAYATSQPMLCFSKMVTVGEKSPFIADNRCSSWLVLSKTFLMANRHLLATLFLFLAWTNEPTAKSPAAI